MPHAYRALQSEVNRDPPGLIDLERLMTRLEGPMPYDFPAGAVEELRHLYDEVKKCVASTLKAAMTNRTEDDLLVSLAARCVERQTSILSFNYDDLFDEALWKVQRLTDFPPPGTKYWHPDGGYGFFCRPSDSCIRDSTISMDMTSMHLLKLHGSLNWRTKLGTASPYSVESVVHDEEWYPRDRAGEREDQMRQMINRHLSPEPLLVPPVLAKSVLTREPILQQVWGAAFSALTQATRVTFVGYSLPVTDIAAGSSSSRGWPTVLRFLLSTWLMEPKTKRK